MASTYRWIGGTGSPDIASNWTLVAGGGNPSGIPDAGDTAIITSGTVQTGADSTLSGNTIIVGGTAGLAGLTFTGSAAMNGGNPSLDQNSVVTSSFTSPPGSAEASLLRSFGTFLNLGSIAAAGTAGSTFTIDIESNGTAPGYFFNQGMMSVEAGNTMSITVGTNAAFFNASAVFVNGGSLNIASAGTASIAGGLGPVRGDFVIRDGGQIEVNTGYPAGVTGLTPAYDFVDTTGVLKLDQPAQFGGRILGFQAGNTIDLVGIGAITQAIYGSNHILALLDAGGTTVASLVFSTGIFEVGTFAVSGGVAGSFGIASAGDDILLTTSATNVAWTNGAGGLWTTAANWSGNSVPGTGDTAVIGDGTPQAYLIQTGTVPVSVGSLMLANQDATLEVTSGLTVTEGGVQLLVGTIDVAAGATLQAANLVQTGGDSAVLRLHTGSTLIATGGSPVGIAANQGTVSANANAHSGLLLNGLATIDGGTINAGPTQSSTAFTGGYIQIGRDGAGGPGVVATNGATITDTYALLYSGPTSAGTLTLSGPNTIWTDAGDPADTLTTRGYISVGVNDIAASPPLDGSAQLVVTDGATLVDVSRAYVGDSVGAEGTATVSDGGQWLIGDAATQTGALRVGLSGNGTLLVLNDTTIAGNGGTVTIGTGNQSFLQNGTTVTQNSALDIGTNVGAFGTVVVAGSGSQLSTAGSNFIGDAGTGVMTVGSVVGGGVAAGGLFTTTGSLVVGNISGGSGTLQVGAGGTVTLAGTNQAVAQLRIGNATGSTGTVTVSGAGSRLTANGQISVGRNGSGALTVANAGSVNALTSDPAASAALFVGQFGNGTVSVTGAGSTLTAQGLMLVGRAGTGQVLVNSGGVLNVTQDVADTPNLGTLQIGVGNSGNLSQTGGFGSATVASGGQMNVQSLLLLGGNGDNGVLAINGGTVSTGGALISGITSVISGTTVSGVGTIGISAGGVLQTTGTATSGNTMVFGRDKAAQGLATVAGGIMSTKGHMVVGDGGTGIVTVGTGGTLSANGIGVGESVGGFGTLTIDGAAAGSSDMIGVGNAGSGILRVQNGGTLTSGGTIAALFGASGSGFGLGLVDGAGSTWNVGGQFIVGAQGLGSVAISNGATVNAGTNAIILGNDSGGSGNISVGGGNARLTGGALIFDNAIGQDATGTLTVSIGGTVAVQSAVIGAGGFLNMQGGLLDPPTVSIGAGGIISGFGILDAALSNAGSILATGGTLEVVGSLTGSGVIEIGNGGSLQLDGAASVSGITFDSGANQALILQSPGTVFTTRLNSLFTDDQIGFNFGSSVSIVAAEVVGSVLTVHRSDSGTYQLTDVHFDAGAAPGFTFSQSGANSFLQIGCFVEGTLIRGEHGEVPVQSLREGNRLPTVLGKRLAPIVWLGRRHIDCTRHPRPDKVWPVRISAHTFGSDLPRRDLLLSPDHAVYVNEVLVPVARLINGTSIRQVEVAEVTYWHVQLPWHDILLSEGLPTESFLESDDRANFENGGAAMALFPDFTARRWETEGCAPLVQIGPELDAIRAMIAAAPAHRPGRTRQPTVPA